MRALTFVCLWSLCCAGCNIGPWSAWSPCYMSPSTKVCGQGTHFRSRSLTGTDCLLHIAGGLGHQQGPCTKACPAPVHQCEALGGKCQSSSYCSGTLNSSPGICINSYQKCCIGKDAGCKIERGKCVASWGYCAGQKKYDSNKCKDSYYPYCCLPET